MSAPPYMKLYWGDYLKDTTHLTAREHGAYLMLIGATWQAGGKLPNDDVLLARHARCTPKEWAAIRDVVMAFFTLTRGKLRLKRVTKELAKYADIIGKRKVAGKKGGTVSHSNDTENRQANASETRSKSPHNQNHNQKGRKEGSKKPSFTSRRAKPDERADGSSSSRSEVVIELAAVRDEKADAEAEAARLQQREFNKAAMEGLLADLRDARKGAP